MRGSPRASRPHAPASSTTRRPRARSSRWTRTPAGCSRVGSIPTYNAERLRHAAEHRAAGRSSTTRRRRRSSTARSTRVYPTGSTFKPITALGALKDGLITAQTLAGHAARACRSAQARSATPAHRLRQPRPRPRADGLRGHLLLPGRRGGERRDRQRPRDPGHRARSWGSAAGPGSTSPAAAAPAWFRIAPSSPVEQGVRRGVLRPGHEPPQARVRARDARDQHVRPGLLRPAVDRRPERAARDRAGLPAGEPRADGGRLLGDRQRRQGLAPADRREDPDPVRPARAPAARRRPTVRSTCRRPTSS